MSRDCPKCHLANLEDSRDCHSWAAPLESTQDIAAVATRTFPAPARTLAPELFLPEG